MVVYPFNDDKSFSVSLSDWLIEKQNISDLNIRLLGLLHFILYCEMNKAKKIDLTDDERKDIVDNVERLEFLMQSTWGFKLNADYHSHWNRIPGCTCPTLDNRDLWGTGRRIYSGNCEFHKIKVK